MLPPLLIKSGPPVWTPQTRTRSLTLLIESLTRARALRSISQAISPLIFQQSQEVGIITAMSRWGKWGSQRIRETPLCLCGHYMAEPGYKPELSRSKTLCLLQTETTDEKNDGSKWRIQQERIQKLFFEDKDCSALILTTVNRYYFIDLMLLLLLRDSFLLNFNINVWINHYKFNCLSLTDIENKLVVTNGRGKGGGTH